MPELEAEAKRHRLAGLEVTADIFIAAIDAVEGDDLDELQQRLKREQKDNEDLEELWEDSETRLQNDEHMLDDNDNMTLTDGERPVIPDTAFGKGPCDRVEPFDGLPDL
jgi:hypothetical protein